MLVGMSPHAANAEDHATQGESVNILLKFAQFFKTSIEYFL